MHYKLELFVKELELDKIRDEKNLAAKNMKYENAAHLRDLEKEKEHEIQEIIYNFQKYFDKTPLTRYNSYELEEISKLIFLYQSDKNNLFKKKIKLTIKNLKNEKEQALSNRDFALYKELLLEIEALKKRLR